MKTWFKSLAAVCTSVVLAFGATVARAQDKELNLFAWSEYVPQSVIDGFTKETGIKVNYETYASNEEMLAKLSAGATPYDLVQPSEYTVEALIKADMLVPIDHSKIPNMVNIDPKFANPAYDPGNKFTVPWMAGTVGIVIDTDKVKDDIKGFADVFSGKYARRIVALDDGREWLTWVLNVQGKDINKITPEVMEGARPTLEKWIKQVKVFDSASPNDKLLTGECDIGVLWSGEAAKLYKENKKYKYVLPVEGTHQFIDNLAIPKTARNKGAATAFMNYILRPEVSVLISEDFPYTNPNAAARKLLTPEQLENPASYPPADAKLELFHDIGTLQADVDKLYQDLRGGM